LVARLKGDADEIRRDALMAGALPQDFRIVHVVHAGVLWTTELR
jgi:hypothetical protein